MPKPHARKRHEKDRPAPAPPEESAASPERAPEPPSPPVPIEEEFEVQEVEMTDEALSIVEDLNRRLEEALAARQRALADFKNLQRRSQENERMERAGGIASVVRSLIPVLDHFDLALAQDQSVLTVEQLLDGVRIVREEIERALEGHGVTAIAPQRGEPFDPTLHQGIMRECTGKQPPNTIVAIAQVGYMIGGRILRPASVVISAPAEGDEDEDYGEDDETTC